MNDPYRPPSATVGNPGAAAPAGQNAEAIRREHIKHEAAIQSVGTLYFIAAGLFALGVLGGLVPMVVHAGEPEAPGLAGLAVVAVLFLGLMVLHGWLGRGLRKLQPSARPVAGVFSVLGLISFPVGTLINGYILWLLFSKKGAYVFTPEYAGVVAATPHVRYRSPLLYVLLGALVLMLALAAWAVLNG